jgi:nucleoside-diphosphate-sugar epimerase
MRILFAGASGVLGRNTLPHLRGHEVTGLTRSPEKLELLRELGVEAAVCDVYELDALRRLARGVQPEVVVNFVTDLASRSYEANSRVRREGGKNLISAATASSAARLVTESVAFALDGDAATAVPELEDASRAFVGASLILRFGRLWGPATLHEASPGPPAVHVGKAGAEAARLIAHAPPGTYVVTDRGTEE